LVKNLSKDFVKRVGLASALIGNPDVLLLDEPVSDVDADTKSAILEIIKEFSIDAEKAVLIADTDEDSELFTKTVILSVNAPNFADDAVDGNGIADEDETVDEDGIVDEDDAVDGDGIADENRETDELLDNAANEEALEEEILEENDELDNISKQEDIPAVEGEV
jgi:ABC-type multidrug transport system ATPase subunit